MKIPQPPYTLPRTQAEALVGHRISNEIFQWPVIGHRILVALEPPKQRYGSIIVPSTSQRFPARGHVIAAGELVGTKWHPASGECTGCWPIRASVQVGEQEDGSPIVESYPAPWTILGARILFGAYAGEALIFEPDVDADEGQDWVTAMRESGMDSLEFFRSPYKIMTDSDVWMYDRRTIIIGEPSEDEARPLETGAVES